MSEYRTTRLAAGKVSGPQYRLTRLAGQAVRTGPAYVTTSIRAETERATVVVTGPTQTCEPFELVTLTALITGNAATITWEQVSGPAVTFTGQGTGVIQFEAPATLDGSTAVFRVTVNPGGSTATAAVTTWPVVQQILIAGVWVPFRETVLVPDTGGANTYGAGEYGAGFYGG